MTYLLVIPREAEASRPGDGGTLIHPGEQKILATLRSPVALELVEGARPGEHSLTMVHRRSPARRSG